MEYNSQQKRVYRSIKHTADMRGYDWELTLEQVVALASSPCFYCGCEPFAKVTHSKYAPLHDWGFLWNGIDRLDNLYGYVPGNVVPCCRYCNWAKNERTVEEFTAWAEQLYIHTRRFR